MKSENHFRYLLIIVLSLILSSVVSYGEEMKAKEQPRLEVAKVSISGLGMLLDVRYRILGETEELSFEPTDSYIIDEATGTKLLVQNAARVGRLASTKKFERVPVPGQEDFIPLQYMIVENQERLVKPGSKVTVVIGGIRQEHVTVEE